ncbi:Eco57I restriction-modification methylase domain-containing protein [Salinicoccus roseus]|uniref:Eco57I restriction-modification methylase domain-containing protein n=1 Tax=Salinicoccus roseus TaxID=45670 RepID=UPI0023010219|nr:N-6 DNA methylase [Salinicoccus roseus]
MNQDNKITIASHLSLYIDKLGYDVKVAWIEKLLKHSDINLKNRIENKYTKKNLDYTPENFLIVSEKFFSIQEKKDNGITYTPAKISTQMAKLSLRQLGDRDLKNCTVIDPALGGGVLLLSWARLLHESFDIPLKELIEKKLFGIDIIEENILISKVTLSLLSLELEGEAPNKLNFELSDAFKVDQQKLVSLFGISEFDLVITNPPYIRSKNLPLELRDFIKLNYTSVHGIVDSYIPFFELSTKIVKQGGVVTLITPNSFLTSLNGLRLREYLINNSSNIKLVNFNNQKVFEGISSYSAITSFIKDEVSNKECSVEYLLDSFIEVDLSKSSDDIWQEVYQKKTWRTLNEKELSIINKLENTFETQLKDLTFKNGVATQRNNLYSFIPEKEDGEYYIFSKDGKTFEIEKDITRPFVTPNERVQPLNQKIIFPYRISEKTGKNEVIQEETIKKEFPYAYRFFSYYKEELMKRASDKNLKAWYAYGRSQGLNDFGNRLYLPYMADKVHTLLSKNDLEVFAAGYAIFHEDIDYLRSIDKIISSELFRFYISKVSKPYSKGYYSTAKNLVKYFSVPSKDYINKEGKEINNICKLYNLTEEEQNIIHELNK